MTTPPGNGRATVSETVRESLRWAGQNVYRQQHVANVVNNGTEYWTRLSVPPKGSLIVLLSARVSYHCEFLSTIPTMPGFLYRGIAIAPEVAGAPSFLPYSASADVNMLRWDCRQYWYGVNPGDRFRANVDENLVIYPGIGRQNEALWALNHSGGIGPPGQVLGDSLLAVEYCYVSVGNL